MITLVTGGSGSGKSEYAESLILAAGDCCRCYIATMKVFGEEDRRKVRRHKQLRRGKGFQTWERPEDLAGLVLGGEAPRAVLLECVMNLAANELFGPENPDSGEAAVLWARQRVLEGIDSLARQSRELVIVTGEVGADGVRYEPETMDYIRLMGELNCALAALADRVVEVVYAIPVWQKEA